MRIALLAILAILSACRPSAVPVHAAASNAMTEQALLALVADTTSPSGRIYRPTEVAKPTIFTSGNPVPRWPRGDGCAIVYFIVGANGRYEEGTGVPAAGSAQALADASLRYLSRWRFLPAVGLDEKPVRQITQVRIVKRGNGTVLTMAPQDVDKPCRSSEA